MELDKPEKIEQISAELDILISKAHRAGIAYRCIFWMLLNKIGLLAMQLEAENFIKGDKKNINTGP